MDSMESIVKLKEIAQNYTILFVEDSQALQKQVVKFLSKLFKEVIVASDGQEGLELYKKNRPDLVLTDLTMPKMTGHEMIREIKKINPDVEIVILSAHSDTETLMKSFHIGVSDFIAKPVNAVKMITVFLKVLSNIKRKEFELEEFKKNEITSPDLGDNDILTFLFENSMKIDIINHYKGVPIINSGKILNIDEDKITLRTTHLQLLAIKHEHSAILDSSLVSEDISCSLISFNLEDYEVVLKKEKLFHPEFKDRTGIVLEPNDKLKAFVIQGKDERIETHINGISTKEILLEISKDNLHLEKHDVINLLIIFSKNEKEHSVDYVNLESRVYKIEDLDEDTYKVVLLIKGNEETENSLQKYIYKRELELVDEFKTKYQYS
ncbi:response regulator [Poseidonibacter lekithochrous]|uniref:response regulator n=1 Tax=Poseidonibacter lekithochrous TaxID=1904463 RepID=UPI0008FC5EB0|nr:response regulator [Poseidonibacter lekithochrous]QKJ23479.1 two-component system response regulator [Poseidonibacter lekithochrous]